MEDIWGQEAVWRGGEVYLLLPQRQLLRLSTPGPQDQDTQGSPPDSLNRPKGSQEDPGSKGQSHRKDPIESSREKGSGDPLEKISLPKGLPELERLLEEFQDVLPEDPVFQTH